MSIPVNSWDIAEPPNLAVCAALLYLTGETAPVLAIACQGAPHHEGAHRHAEQRPQTGRWMVEWSSAVGAGEARDGA